MENDIFLKRILAMPHGKKEVKLLFAQQFYPVTLQKGQVLIIPNVINQSLYFISNGILRNYAKHTRNMGTRQLYIAGDFVAQNGAYLKYSSLEYIDCITDVNLMGISYKQLDRFFRKNPEAIKLLICIMEEQKLKEIDSNVLLHLETALERYQYAILVLGKHVHDIPKQVLASYLRVSRKQLGRITLDLVHRR